MSVKLAKYTINKAKQRIHQIIRQYGIDEESLNIVTVLDSSSSNNEDHGTQIGYIVLMMDATKRVNWMNLEALSAYIWYALC